MPPIPNIGIIAKDSTIIPIPPIHWVTLRQYRMPLLTASISVRMVAPVVVNPDMVSKNASVKLSMLPDNRKGSVPNSEITTQVELTMINPSRLFITW